jgi:uncharacterized protein
MVVVSDTSPLINLAIIGHLDLIPKLFYQIILPQAVFNEIIANGATLPGAKEILQSDWIEVRIPKDLSLVGSLMEELDSGESEAIALALEIGADLLLMDEFLGRKAALNNNIRPLGILGILLEGKRQGIIPTVQPIMNALIHEAGFYVHAQLYQDVLELAGE